MAGFKQSEKHDPRHKTTILFLASNPLNTDRLRLDTEIRAIDNALRKAKFRDSFILQQQWAVSTQDLQSLLLRYNPDIIHFSGHRNDFSELIFEDQRGNPQSISTRALGQLFGILTDKIRCVILNSCYSENQASAIAEHIDCVMGIHSSTDNQAAISFASSFYLALASGKSVKVAFDLGCNHQDLARLPKDQTPHLLAPNCNPKKVFFVQ